jgi:CubicO group peptidase (beta-lactamase class C family)
LRTILGKLRSCLRTLPFFALPILLATACRSTAGSSTRGLETRVRGVTQGVFTGNLSEAMANSHVPGVSIAVINDFAIDWAKANGLTASGTDRAVDRTTLFQASSITKSVTSTAVLKLVDRRILELDSDVNMSLRTWKLPDSPFTASRKVTLRELLSHTACVNRPDGGFGHEGRYPTTTQILNGERPATNAAVQIECVPGSRFAYSNFGYVIVQQLVEDVTGQPFPTLARELVLEPARMKSSTLEQPLRGPTAGNAAFPHDIGGKPMSRFYNPNAVAQGGLWTTPSDLARFLIEIMRSRRGMSDGVVSEESARQMLTPHYRNLDGAQFWGLGFIVLGDWGIFQAGSDPGFRCLMAGFPRLGKGIVVMLNGENGEFLQLRLLLNFLLEYVIRPSALPFAAGGLSALVLLLGLTGWPVGSACRRLVKPRRLFARAALGADRRGRTARVIGTLTAAVILGTAYPYLLSSFRPGGLVVWSEGTPLAKTVVLLAVLGAVLSAVMAVVAVGLWRSRIGSLAGRCLYSCVALSALTGSCLWLALVTIQ